MRKAHFLFVGFLFIVACKSKEKIPADVLPPPRMQSVLWDMMSASEFLSGYILSKDSIDKMAESSKIYSQVLQVHHITKAEFDKSYLYYREHPAMLKIILDSLSKKQLPPLDSIPKQVDTMQKILLKEPVQQ